MRVTKRSHRYILENLSLLLTLLLAAISPYAKAQEAGSLRGQVLDPTGAVVPDAVITLSQDGKVTTTRSGQDGVYLFRALPAGTYSLSVDSQGFALASKITAFITAGQSRQLNLPLVIAVEQQNVQVTDQSSGVSLNPDENSSALVIRGGDLDALSDDPDQLQNELQALAGPAAGPNGGQIYIDGFSGGQLPPKSSIREIRVNQNPFSAEYDRIGYGRIEILTKPGTDVLHGRAFVQGNDSALNTGAPFAPPPAYHAVQYNGTISGSINKKASFFLTVEGRDNPDASVYTVGIPIQSSSPSSYVPVNP